MHGRLKVRTSAQEAEIKRKEREKKIKIYKAVMAKIMQKRAGGEMDDEMLSITSQTLQNNPDIYTLWNIRREILLTLKNEKSDEEMSASVDNEVRLTENCLQVNPKSYCAWFHRGWVLDLHPSPNWKRELALCTKFLTMDERNFHCWDYRRLAAKKSQVSPKEEFDFSTEKIHDNFSNYSAWHYRSKLLPITDPDPSGVALVDPEKHRHELELVQNAAFTDPNDTSAWFYQRWLLGRDCSESQKAQPAVLQAFLDSTKAVVSFTGVSKCAPEILVNGTKINGTWTSPSQYIWLLQRGDKIKGDNVEVVGRNGSLILMSQDGEAETFMGVAADDSFNKVHDPVVLAELKGQLVCCQQLLQMEPDSKWTLLTLVLLMQAIDRSLYHMESMQSLEKLITVDPLRKGYYNDLWSKYVMEFKLSLNGLSMGLQREINLSSCQLSSLYFMNRLVLVKVVDLSDNKLQDYSLGALASLQLCQSLNLKGNQLETLHGFPSLPALKHLNVSSNKLVGQAGVVKTNLKNANLISLQEIVVMNNPCFELNEIQELVKNLDLLK